MDIVIELNRIADGIPDVHEFGAAGELLGRLRDRLKKPLTNSVAEGFTRFVDKGFISAKPVEAGIGKAARKIGGGMFKKDYQI